MKVWDLDTPALVVDLDRMERNLRRAAEYARQHQLHLRPHTKTHKSVYLAGKQMELGAIGLTVAKVGEAEIMAQTEPPELLVMYPVIGKQKLERLASIARSRPVLVALDSFEAASALSEAACFFQVEFGVLVEFDVGLHRCGVQSTQQLVELARSISKLPRLRWDGVAFYPGHIKKVDEAGLAAIDQLARDVADTLSVLEGHGLSPRIVSGGSTPTLFHSHKIPGMTEIRPGTYIFNDRNTVLLGACTWDDCAAYVLTTVVSTAVPGQIVIDGGSKTFFSDPPPGGSEVTFGHIIEAPDARFIKMNEEHGYIRIEGCGRQFAVGDKLRVIPNHICVVMNLHDRVFGVRGDDVVTVWQVDARGKVR